MSIHRRHFLFGAALASATLAGTAVAGVSSVSLDRWRAALAEARIRQIARLARYRKAGRFPTNHRVLGSIPVFVDEHGVPCAVGHLMAASGQTALMKAVAAADNHVYIEKIMDGPALDWILRSGLTQDECAMIQPSYSWQHRCPPLLRPVVPQDRLVAHFIRVEERLLEESSASLDAALARLEPRIRGQVEVVG